MATPATMPAHNARNDARSDGRDDPYSDAHSDVCITAQCCANCVANNEHLSFGSEAIVHKCRGAHVQAHATNTARKTITGPYTPV
eukprot:11082294-Alexandrium_andersonii.AAC.1